MYQNETTAEQELKLLCLEAGSGEGEIPESLLSEIEHFIFVVQHERRADTR